MRDYSKVSPQFWIGATGKKLRAQGIECQLVALYLMTCSHANMLGIYYLPKVYIAHECGLTLEGANKGLQSAIDAGFCSYDDPSEMVWVHEMATYQISEQLKAEDKRILGVQNEYNTIPDCPYLLDFFNKYKSQFFMTQVRGEQAPIKPLVSQEQEQEQIQEQEQKQEHDQEQEFGAENSAPTKNGTRLPADWLLPKAWGDWALADRPEFTADQVRRIAESFRDHWVANANQAKSKKSDWQAAWRIWFRKEQLPTGSNFKSTGQKRIENTNKAVAEFLGAEPNNNIIEGEYQHA